MTTHFTPIPGTADGVSKLLSSAGRPLIIVSRHGLGDNIFFSPCFERLAAHFPVQYFCSSVNAYTTIFHDSKVIKPLYAGSVNGAPLGLTSSEGFARHFMELHIDIGYRDAYVYHFGLFEPDLPYSDERAYVKGRRNAIELFGDGPPATQVPIYHVAPDAISKQHVDDLLRRWTDGSELIVIARYGHTDPEKNFGDDYRATMEVASLLNFKYPDRFRFLSLDFIPGEHAADGRLNNLRSIYGFLPCDAASLHHVLRNSRLLVTVPSGPMLVGATISSLKLLTLWKSMSPYHFLDPQYGGRNPVHALVNDARLLDRTFQSRWTKEAISALEDRWRFKVAPITPERVATEIDLLLGSP